MEQFLLLLLFGVIALVQWLVKKSGEMREERKRQQQPPQWREEHGAARETRENEPPAPAQAEDPDASMRRLMEALGLPQEAPPPPIPQRTPAPPPLPPTPVPRVPERTIPKFAERPAPKIAEKTFSKLPERSFTSVSKLPTSGARSAAAAPVPETAPGFSIRELLASPDSMKKAVILSEILGAPKTLKS